MERADIATALADQDVDARRRVVMQLPDLSGTAVAHVIVALGDEDWRVREEAVRAGERLLDLPGLVPALVSAVSQGENVGLRNAALELLKRFGSRAVDSVMQALPVASDSARRFLTEALASGGGAAARSSLIPALASPDANMVVAAVDALSHIGGYEAQQALLALMGRPDSYLRLCALEGLGRMQVEVPFDVLAVQVEDKLVRRAALACLGRSQDPRSVAVLIAVLRDAPQSVAEAATRALHVWLARGEHRDVVARVCGSLDDTVREVLRGRASGGDRAASGLLLLSRDESGLRHALRQWVDAQDLEETWLWAVGAWGEPGLRALLDVARGSDASLAAVALEVACRVAEATSPASRESLRSVLRDALRSADEALCCAALGGLGRWGEGEDADRLAEHCSDERPEIAAAAASALELLGDRSPEEVRAVLARLDLAAFHQPSLMRSLISLEAERAEPRLQQALAHFDAGVRLAAVEALARLGTPLAAEWIGLSLTDESDDVQASAARALGELARDTGQAVSTDALVFALANAAPEVRAEAARALGMLKDPRALAALQESLRGGDAIVQLAAIEALRSFDLPEVGDLLVEALGHPDVEVVKQALQGLAERPHPRMATRLALALGHASWDVRQLAAELLGGLDEASATDPLLERFALERDPSVKAAIEAALARVGKGG